VALPLPVGSFGVYEALPLPVGAFGFYEFVDDEETKSMEFHIYSS
jgi:hypothetical protein